MPKKYINSMLIKNKTRQKKSKLQLTPGEAVRDQIIQAGLKAA